MVKQGLLTLLLLSIGRNIYCLLFVNLNTCLKSMRFLC